MAELNLQARDREVLVKVIEQIRNIELLMKNLLNYARPVAAQPVSFNVNRILEKSVYFIERHPAFLSGDPPKKMIKELDESLPEIVGDPQQLQQVFLNLLLNAADAIPDGGEIAVKTRRNEEGRSVAIELHNTGKEISARSNGEDLSALLYHQGKGEGDGTGIGRFQADCRGAWRNHFG